MVPRRAHLIDVDPDKLDAADVVRVWQSITQRVVHYGFSIKLAQLEKPRTGTFNGIEILLSPGNNLELQCFLLLHLFGHSVQWVAPSLKTMIEPVEKSPDLETFLIALRAYESQAAQFGLQLLHESGVTDVDGWFCDFAASDWRYVERFYREGQIPPWHECKVDDGPTVTPLEIPPLKHRIVDVRFAF